MLALTWDLLVAGTGVGGLLRRGQVASYAILEWKRL
jgi:hypothetical protein